MTSQETNPSFVLTVSQLTQAIKINLESTFPSIWLQGEVSNCKQQSSGHLYFSLKDPKAQISAVMFRGQLNGTTRLPKDGDHLVVYGELNVYPPNGKYQLIVKEMRYAGVGELLLKLEELKKKLHKQGWFDSSHKKRLPKFPKCIGVITSPTGAAIQDILNVLTRRFSGFHLILNPVRVQGEGAAQEIAKAIYQMNEYPLVDVLIVGRGGGSLEDLWPFNEEIVAEAIFRSTVPIISAVGHETDHSIADYVADVRAPTPSAAAEMVIAEKSHCLLQLSQYHHRLSQHMQQKVRHHQQQLKGIYKQPLIRFPYTLLIPSMQKLDSFKEDLHDLVLQTIEKKQFKLQSAVQRLHALRPDIQISNIRLLLKQKQERLTSAWRAKVHKLKIAFNSSVKRKHLNDSYFRLIKWRRERLNGLICSLRSVDPKNLLKKGYGILLAEKDHSVITSVSHIKEGEGIAILLADGEMRATINKVCSSEPDN